LIFVPAGDERPKLIIITSAMPDEGKSTIAANLARTLALGGSRVLLVDGDLRRGALDRLMGLPRAPGLTEALQQPEKLEGLIQRDLLPNLSFISRGCPCANPGDLFLSPAFDKVLTRLRQQFDYVLIDSTPVFAADDVTSMASKADGTLFVVRRGYSSARAVEEAIDVLSQRQARILGLIFNRADASARSYYYYKRAEYFTSAPAA
jgi:capsular exopolysaccharide synthesis family protein